MMWNRAAWFGAGSAWEHEPGLSALCLASSALSLAASQNSWRRAGKAGTYLVNYLLNSPLPTRGGSSQVVPW